MTKVLAVDGVPVSVLRKSNWAAPGTEGELRADTEAQAAHRELIARQRFLERRIAVGNSRFNSYEIARDRDEQLRISRELDADEAELSAVRRELAAYGPRGTAASDGVVAKTDRARGRDALSTIMHTPTLRKDELPSPLDLDNSVGTRTQVRIKE